MNSLQTSGAIKSSPPDSASPAVPAKRQRRKKNPETDGTPPPKKSKPASARPSSIIGVTRSISACLRCRLRKTRCDQKFPSCTSCFKAKVECVGIDAATGREIPRSYVSHLEDRVAQLELQLQKHGVEVDESPLDSHPPRSELANSEKEPAQANHTASTTSHNQPKKPESHVDNLMSSVKMVSVNSGTIPPSSYLGSSSGLSFAKLLFTAVKFKSHETSVNTPSVLDPTENSKPKVVKQPPLPPKAVAESLLSIFFSQANAQLPVLHREQFLVKYFKPTYGTLSANVSLASDYTTIGVPVGEPYTPCDKDSYYAKHYGTTSPIFNMKTEPSTGNPPQCPAIDEEILNQPIPASINPRESLPALFFLNIVFGIATSAHQQNYPAQISESFRAAAMNHVDSVLSSPNRLEALQGILLLALYSIMRPAVPGVWYVLGSAMRLCVDLGLHSEGGMKSWYKTSATSSSNSQLLSVSNQEANNSTSQLNIPEYDAATLDMRRRLFWCTYALDRQVCVYLGRPVGIPEHSIKASFPSELDDTLIVDSSFGSVPEGGMDYILEKSTSPSYKIISLSFFKVRKLQAEIQQILYDCAPLGRQYSSLEEWRNTMAVKLETWRNECPKSKKRMNCNFNLLFIDFNYHHTRLLLYGICPANTSPLTLTSYQIIAESGEQVIRSYYELHEKKSINYTWVAVHNLFMAGTSYLYALYHSPEVRVATSIDDIHFNTTACTNVLSSLVSRCDAAVSCRDTFLLLTAAILKLCYDEQANFTAPPPNSRPDNKDNTGPIPFNQSYMPRAGSLINPLGGTTQDIKLEPDVEQESNPSMGMAGSTEGMSMFDSGNQIWPEDLDLFFREAAQLDGISPGSDVSGTGGLGSQQIGNEDSQYQVDDDLPESQLNDIGTSGNPSMPLPDRFGNNMAAHRQTDQYSSASSSVFRPRANRNDGQRIYDIITEVPMAAIWDQFFTSSSSSSSISSGTGYENTVFQSGSMRLQPLTNSGFEARTAVNNSGSNPNDGSEGAGNYYGGADMTPSPFS